MINDKIIIIFNPLLIVVALASIFLVWAAAAEQTTTTNQNVTTTNATNNVTVKVNQVIKEGLNECSNLETSTCLGVMYTLDNICQVAYFPNCFNSDANNEWSNFMNHLQDRIDKGDYSDAGYEDDPYLTLNNHHYGSSEWMMMEEKITK
jgi:hypothetical protein